MSETLPPSIVEAMARALCFHGAYEDDGDTETLVCQRCLGPQDCEDWPIHSLGYQRMAQAALHAALPLLLADMMEPSRDVLCFGSAAAFKALTEEGPDGPHPNTDCFDLRAIRTWQAMLKAHFAERYGIKEE